MSPCGRVLSSTTICSQMTSNSSQLGISALFASASMAPLLRLFMLDPEREYYQRELQRLTSVHLRQLQRDLARLEQSGLVESRSHGNRTYYRAAASHPAFADMRGLVLKTVGLGDVVRDALRSAEVAIDVAFIFGSFAAGDAAAGSDVDLLVVGSVSRRDLAVAVNAAAAELGRELNPVIFTCPEFAERWRADDHFVSTVLAGPRIWLIGDDTTLAALA